MDAEEKAKLEFENCIKLRNFEIDNFWKRSWFFGALIIALYTLYFKLSGDIYQSYKIYVSFIIVAVTICQSLINRGSKYWQERWEFKTKNKESQLGIDVTLTEGYSKNEKSLIEHCIRQKDENIFSSARRFSVSKLTILVCDIIAISSIFIWLNEVIKLLNIKLFWDFLITHWKIVLFHLGIMLYIFFFWFNGKVWEPLSKINNKKDLKECDDYTHNQNKENYL